MHIAHMEEHSFIYGPGCRFVIWTQGCSIRCKGCWNHAMWDFSAGSPVTVPELFTQITALGNSIEGITLLGGEPLDQYQETLMLLRLCSEAGLSAMLFTGYEMPEIMQKNRGEIKEYLDILITGRYDERKRTLRHQWIGSTNQEILFLTDRYAHYKIHNANYTEVSIDEDGSCTVLGFPTETMHRLIRPIP